MSGFLKILAGVYGVLCLLALFVIPASANGWFGFEPDPLSAVPAIFLALPWSLGFGLLGEVGAFLSVLALVGAMLTNAGILYGVSRLIERKGP
ncbi:hypothetical protein [Rubrobacter indicoceani]|uniref:hypothetical protein n=1 Tax=Rubrobacter indicoceani TaxID=2051957 RepID=UPI000E5A9198|nr:hypothetical protein [Rubrobacter indicoceani]